MMTQIPSARRVDQRLFWGLFGSILAVSSVLVAPVLVGRFFGHRYGGIVAIIVAIGWIAAGLKIRMVSSTRLLWVLGLFFIAGMALRELQRW